MRKLLCFETQGQSESKEKSAIILFIIKNFLSIVATVKDMINASSGEFLVVSVFHFMKCQGAPLTLG